MLRRHRAARAHAERVGGGPGGAGREEDLAEEVNEAFRSAAAGEMAGILGVSDIPLVSKDFAMSDVSTTIDSSLTMVMVRAWMLSACIT